MHGSSSSLSTLKKVTHIGFEKRAKQIKSQSRLERCNYVGKKNKPGRPTLTRYVFGAHFFSIPGNFSDAATPIHCGPLFCIRSQIYCFIFPYLTFNVYIRTEARVMGLQTLLTFLRSSHGLICRTIFHRHISQYHHE